MLADFKQGTSKKIRGPAPCARASFLFPRALRVGPAPCARAFFFFILSRE
jgi:hypothetical protein